VDFSVSHFFDAGPDEVASALLDEGFQASLDGISALAERKVLSQETNGDRVVRRVRCVLDIDISGPAKRFIGNGDPAWVEVGTWHPEEMAWRWIIEPEVAGELLAAEGVTRLSPDGQGTRRDVSGSVRVRVPIYGGRVEGWIVDGIERAYDEEAERLVDWLHS
jgi:hypothetical protein